MKITLTQDIHVQDPHLNLWGPGWVGQRTVDMPSVPLLGDGIAIGSASHRPTVEARDYVVRSGSWHVRLSAIRVPDPARLDTEIQEQEDLGFKRVFFAS